MPPDRTFTLAELSALAGIPVRTIRYYLAQGLLPGPGREGPSTRYDEAALARLRLIRRARDRHLPLAAIRAELASLSDEEVIALAEAPPVGPEDGALDYVRSLLAADSAGTVGSAGGPLMRRTSRALADLSVHAPGATPPSPALVSAPPATLSTPALLPSVPSGSIKGPAAPERSQWERIVIEPDIELHVRRPLSRSQNRRVERLLAFARELTEGDPS